MHLMCAPDGVGFCFGQPQEPHLAVLDESAHGTYGFFDRYAWVDAVLVIEINHVNTQTLQARLARLSHVFRPTVHTVDLALAAHLTELGGKHDAIAQTLDGTPNNLLVVAPAIHVGGVEVVDTELDGPANEVFGLGIVGRAIDPRQRHAAQPDRGHRKSLGAERAARKFVHRLLLSKLRTPESRSWYSPQGRTGTFRPPAGALSCPTTW